jgi:hypothetical protein
MAALALGAIGAGVGSFFGYASIGWSVGSALGNYLFAPSGPDTEGPRLTDRSVSGSTYGQMRPMLFGTYRMSGEIIWAADLKEYKKKTSSGKGGGGGSYTTYTYTASFAIALCEGEIDGVRKIWLDNKLVYTAEAGVSAAQLQVSGKIAKGIKIYTGSETQTADPTIESYLGAGNVPGYRGTAYMVFKELKVTQYGNRIPQITVEVVKNGTYSITSTLLNDDLQNLPAGAVRIGDGVIYGYPLSGISLGVEPSVFTATWDYDGVIRKQTRGNIYFTDALFFGALSETLEPLIGDQKPYYWSTYLVSPKGKFLLADAGRSTGSNRRIAVLHRGPLGYTYMGLLATESSLSNQIDSSQGAPNVQVVESPEEGVELSIYFYHYTDGKLYRFDVIRDILGNFILETVPIWVAEVDSSRYGDDSVGGPAVPGFAIDYGTIDIYCLLKNKDTGVCSVKRFDKNGNEIEEKLSGITLGTSMQPNIAYDLGMVWLVNGNTTGSNLLVYSWDDESLLYSKAVSAYFLSNLSNMNTVSLSASGNVMVMMAEGILSSHAISLVPTAETLSSVVEQICNAVGLEDSEIDVTDLASDSVRGYLIANQTPARGALEQLSAAYFFDGRESDGVLEFVKRGDTPIVTLDDDDLGCYEGDNVIELAEAVRIQEEELPKALTINYANVDRDYQTGAQYSIRQSVLNGTEATIQLPIVFTDDEAKAIVDKLMFSAWENRHKFTITTWQSFCKLDPADVITARGETLRIISRNEGVNGLIELEAVRELPQIYTGQVGTGAPAPDEGQDVYVGGPTLSYLLDIPPLRDTDAFDYVAYWAADGILDDWAGATLLRNNGSNYTTESITDTAAESGLATTALGDWNGQNIFDESNVVRVSVSGTLESKTELEVLNGENVALLGDEIIQFKNATLISTGIYDLSGLLRGRLGTDWAMADHAEGDTFVLLTSEALRTIELDSTDLNVERNFGTITHGKTIEDISAETLTYTGNNLKPFAPIEIGGGTAGFNTAWTINWKRRSRYQWQWRDYYDAGEDEDSRDFEVRIYNSVDTPVTVVRTITVTNALTTSYTYANQVTDFGMFQRSIAVSIRQVGEYRNSEWSDIVTLSSGVPQFNPSLWLDASDSSTITIATGVSQWNDKSVHAQHVTQGTGANQPTRQTAVQNGLDIIRFDGTNDALTRTTDTGLLRNQPSAMLISVRKATSVAAARSVFALDGGTSQTRAALYVGLAASKASAGGRRLDADAFQSVASAANVDTANFQIHVGALDYTNSDLYQYINGTLDGSSTSFLTAGNTSDTVSANLFVGHYSSANFFQGDIGELIIIHGDTSTTTRQFFEGYLAWKWGLVASLQADHPYKLAPP